MTCKILKKSNKHQEKTMIFKYNNKKKIYFSKMHGLGNDFAIINCIDQNVCINSSIIKKLSNRHRGIGFDQLLLVKKAHNSTYDFHYEIFNSNGNEVEQCGNGARCFGMFLKLYKLTNKKQVFIKTNNRDLIIKFINNKTIQVNMNEPYFKLNQIFLSQQNTYDYLSKKKLLKNLKYNLVSVGNPHCIIKVKSIKYAPVQKISKIIENNCIFSEGININFMEIVRKNYIKLRVYERDVGETYACGSGACAAVAVGISQNLLTNKVEVELHGGNMIVKWNGVGHPLYMQGPAKHVYDGYIYI